MIVRRVLLTTGCAGLWLSLVPAALGDAGPNIGDMPAVLQEKVVAAQTACQNFENGTLAVEWGAIVRVDLDGDHRLDWVLNEQGFACSSAVSLFCGTGGCVSHFLVGEQLHSLLNTGWAMRVLGPHRVLLADVHGTDCAGYGYTPCVTASVWDPEAGVWRSARAKWDE